MNKQLGFEFNQNYCVGCQACEVACQVKNGVDEGIRWRVVSTHVVQRNGREVERFLSQSCMHCAEPACMKVCPVQAYSKRADGIVVQDHEKCIGCGKCIEACPYKAPVMNMRLKKAEKCDFCVDLVDRGEPPTCVRACPVQILKFGELEEMRRRGLGTSAVGFKLYATRPSMRFVAQKA